MGVIVIGVYKPHAGHDEEVAALLRAHGPTLQAEGLVEASPYLLLRSPTDGAYLEIFQWTSEDAVREAHERHAVQDLWDRLERIAEFATLSTLADAAQRFPRFEIVAGGFT